MVVPLTLTDPPKPRSGVCRLHDAMRKPRRVKCVRVVPEGVSYGDPRDGPETIRVHSLRKREGTVAPWAEMAALGAHGIGKPSLGTAGLEVELTPLHQG